MLLINLIFSSVLAFSQTAPVEVRGVLLEKGTKKPMASANVYAFSPPEAQIPVKAVTDAKGAFVLGVPEGPVRWRISVAGYKVFEKTEAGVAAKKFYLEKNSYLVYETTVFGQEEKRDDKTQSLTRAQFMTLPGANGDPVKAIQNLPGVNRSNGSGAQVIIEGSAPSDTRYNIDTQPVPIIFHFGGLTSVVMPDAVDHVDYLSAGFGPEYGETIAGMVNLTTKEPEHDRVHAMGYVDIFQTGGFYERPLSDHSSLFVGARKSYVGQILKLAMKSNKDFNLTVAPDFDDALIMYQNKLDDKNSLRVTAIGSRDTIGFVLPEPPDSDPALRGNFGATTTFYRLIPQFTHKSSAATTERFWLGLGQDMQQVDFADMFYHINTSVVSMRAEVEHDIMPTWKSFLGVENVANFTKFSYRVPYVPDSSQTGTRGPIGTTTTLDSSKTAFSDLGGVYWRNVIHSEGSKWTYMPGLRVAVNTHSREVMPEPRAAIRYLARPGLTLRSSAGMYDEAPPPQDLDSNFGNPNLRAQRAVHLTAGAEKDFRADGSNGWVLSGDLFYKYLYNLVQNTSAYTDDGRPQFYNNNGKGRVYGAEFLLKYQSKTWSGWLAYTISKSMRTYPPKSEQIFQYDQTHNLTLIAEREMGRNWKFSGRFRYTTGNPYTPVVGSTYDVDNDVYTPISGTPYSSRLEPFYQLDARFDKKWVMNSWILTGYLDVQNVTNHKNPQQINYSYNYRDKAVVTGLPILPTIGIKGEF